MIRTLDRMVAGSFVWLFCIFVFSVPIIFVLADLSERQGQFLDRGLTVADIALGYVFMYPHFMVWSAPIATLIAAVFTVNYMTTHREILAAKAGGVSFHRLVAPLWPVGAILTAAVFFVGALVPSTTRTAAEIFGDREVRGDWRNNFVHRTEDDETLSVQQLFVSNRSMDRVLLESRDQDGSLRHVWANQGYYGDEGVWELRDGYLRVLHPSGQETSYTFDRYRRPGFNVPPEELRNDPPDENEMGYDELGRRAAAVYRSGGNPDELLVKRDQKLAIPAATLVIMLFGAPLATTVKKGGATLGVGVSLGSTILYIMLMRFFGAIGASGGMSPLWAAWVPNVIFLVVGLILMARVRT